jgi:hypothetical protein
LTKKIGKFKSEHFLPPRKKLTDSNTFRSESYKSTTETATNAELILQMLFNPKSIPEETEEEAVEAATSIDKKRRSTTHSKRAKFKARVRRYTSEFAGFSGNMTNVNDQHAATAAAQVNPDPNPDPDQVPDPDPIRKVNKLKRSSQSFNHNKQLSESRLLRPSSVSSSLMGPLEERPVLNRNRRRALAFTTQQSIEMTIHNDNSYTVV